MAPRQPKADAEEGDLDPLKPKTEGAKVEKKAAKPKVPKVKAEKADKPKVIKAKAEKAEKPAAAKKTDKKVDDKKEKVKAVVGEEAEQAILEYLKSQNRPFSATEVSANLHGKVRFPSFPYITPANHLNNAGHEDGRRQAAQGDGREWTDRP